MNLEVGRLHDILRAQHPGDLSPVDAEVIVAIAQLAVDADGREDIDEVKLFFSVGKALFALAGMAEASTPTFAADEDDDERLLALANQLEATASRELAYSVAFLLMVADVAIAPQEDELLERLRVAFAIDEGRAAQLAATISAAITPPG